MKKWTSPIVRIVQIMEINNNVSAKHYLHVCFKKEKILWQTGLLLFSKDKKKIRLSLQHRASSVSKNALLFTIVNLPLEWNTYMKYTTRGWCRKAKPSKTLKHWAQDNSWPDKSFPGYSILVNYSPFFPPSNLPVLSCRRMSLLPSLFSFLNQAKHKEMRNKAELQWKNNKYTQDKFILNCHFLAALTHWTTSVNSAILILL